MKVIISPAKSFKEISGVKTEELIFENKTKELVKTLKSFSMSDIGNMFKVNDYIMEKVYYDYNEFDFKRLDNPALFSYDGLVYKQFSMKDFDDLDYLNNHVYIFSALFGLLKPMTGIRDYRLDMTIKEIDMYDFWKDLIYKEAYKDEKVFINLSSKEYSKLLKDFLKEDERLVDIVFKDLKNGKLRTIVAWTKQMRGKFLKEIICEKIEDPDNIKGFEINGYIFDSSLSSRDEFVFVRRQRWKYFIYLTFT